MASIEMEEIKKHVQDVLNQGVTKPSSSPCGSLIVLVPKKDDTWRMCVDSRALNKITVKNRYPLPRINELLDQLKNVVYFTKLDLHNRYHQARVAEKDIWKIAFKTKQGLFEWMVIPFRLCNALATFMRYWRMFIANFSVIATPLHALTSVKKAFQWGGKQQKSFDTLKENINTTPVLALPDLHQPFEIETNGSGYAMGTVLM
eukprot:PITA_35929